MQETKNVMVYPATKLILSLPQFGVLLTPPNPF